MEGFTYINVHMAMIKELQAMCDQHDQLRELAVQFALELDKPVPDLPSLASGRWKLMRLVIQHLAFEDTHVYAVLAQCGGAVHDVGHEMAAESGHLYDSFQTHVREWTPQAILADWPAYCDAARTLLTALDNRMDREEKDLYPLVVMAKAA